MRYEGPIYRPPSEARSLLIQATVGCPHNRCTFCMVYKQGPRYRVRSVADIKTDLRAARDQHGQQPRTLFFPAGNTIAMRTDDLCAICVHAREIFPDLERITIYGSAQYICQKGLKDLKRLARAGLTRIHVGLESGDDVILKHVQKGATSAQQVKAGQWVRQAGIELSLYVILGIGGKARTCEHATLTARAINAVKPDFTRLRTFVPKINTPLLKEVSDGRFEMLGPRATLRETAALLSDIRVDTRLTSDHYTNYINLEGRLPRDNDRLQGQIQRALKRDDNAFRPFFIGNQ